MRRHILQISLEYGAISKLWRGMGNDCSIMRSLKRLLSWYSSLLIFSTEQLAAHSTFLLSSSIHNVLIAKSEFLPPTSLHPTPIQFSSAATLQHFIEWTLGRTAGSFRSQVNHGIYACKLNVISGSADVLSPPSPQTERRGKWHGSIKLKCNKIMKIYFPLCECALKRDIVPSIFASTINKCCYAVSENVN